MARPCEMPPHQPCSTAFSSPPEDRPGKRGRVASGSLAAAVAQVNTSTMDGLVADPQGALIARAEVAVTNTLTGQVFRTITDDKGHWAVPALSTATYSVTASAPGFKKTTKDGVSRPSCRP
jgi:hypothetical protein